MGLSNPVSAGIIFLTIGFLVFLIPSIFDKSIDVVNTTSETSILENEISQTDISLDSISSIFGSSIITFNMTNNGNVKLWDFEKFDVLITFDGSSSGRLSETLTYSGNCSGNPSAGNWCLDSITNDNLDPNMVNNGEKMNAIAAVSETLTTGIAIVVVTTDNGVVSTNSDSI